ncbi:type II secretion system inner membrane protein GspF [soil metagenome]
MEQGPIRGDPALTNGMRPTGVGGQIRIEELIALNDEIAALVRAGVPLERGLLDLGVDVRGRLGKISRRLGERMAAGRSLPEALEEEGPGLPGLYRAIVEAGLRSGHLPSALEGLAGFARGLADLRRIIGLAMLYPLMVLVLAYGLFLAFVVELAPRFSRFFDAMHLPINESSAFLARLGETAIYWGPIPPLLLLFWGIGWARSTRLGGLIGWLPGMRRLLADARATLYAEMLALLIENQTPLPDAIVLAAEASGDARHRRAAAEAAEATRRGEDLRVSFSGLRAFPPMLRWLIATGKEQGGLAPALRHAAQTYRRRAWHRAELIRIFLPILLTVLIGGVAAFLYGLTLFVPFARLLEELTY